MVKPGWISTDEFLAGYGAAQAVPGPMFTLAAYLGARLPGAEGGSIGASVATIAIFLPGFCSSQAFSRCGAPSPVIQSPLARSPA